MDFLYLIVIGLVAGWLAGLIMKGRGLGFFGNIIVGIIGALIGGWLLWELGINMPFKSGFVNNLLSALGGAIVLLFLASLVSGRKK